MHYGFLTTKSQVSATEPVLNHRDAFNTFTSNFYEMRFGTELLSEILNHFLNQVVTREI
jgi:hypothetical protein